jgi:hypothetical protein
LISINNHRVYWDHPRRNSPGQAPIGPVHSRLAIITQLRIQEA